LTCLQHSIPSTNRLSFAGWTTPSAYVAHPGSGSTPTSLFFNNVVRFVRY